MNDRPSNDPEHIQALFAQLDGLGFDAVESDIDQLVTDIQHDVDALEAQQAVIEALASEDAPDDVLVALVLARIDPTMNVFDIRLKLTEIAYLVPAVADQATQLSEVMHSIWELANVVEGASYKSEVQTDILTSDVLTPEVKRYLLTALDTLSDEPGIDLSDEDQVSAAYAEAAEEKKHDEEAAARKEKVKALVSELEPQFLAAYSVHLNDPAWKDARSIGITHVMIGVEHSRTLMMPEAFGVHEHLDALRIPYDEYMNFFEHIIDTIIASEQA